MKIKFAEQEYFFNCTPEIAVLRILDFLAKFKGRVMFTSAYAGAKIQFRCWDEPFGVIQQMMGEIHVDSCGKGLLIHCEGNPAETKVLTDGLAPILDEMPKWKTDIEGLILWAGNVIKK